ncbi:MAG: zinc metalloprotease HtpX [Bacteroidetes bacterium]|nr:zinc metalloprotease HtpX [Bacteroidota bacterium]MBU2471310.1 zinc metalloprotease HtpX [Bacteroidota bacterium]
MNTFKTFLLMLVLTLLLIFVGNLLGGQGGMMIAFLFAIVMNFGTYWFSDKIVLKMYKAQPVTREDSPELYRMTEELTARAGIPMPKLYIIPNDQPNAFATGRNPQNAAVAVTQGILRILTKEELMGVIAHELSHVKHRDILIGTVAATIAGAISMLAHMAQWAMIFGGGGRDNERGGNPIAMIVMIIVAPLAAMIVQMAISRSREYLADEGGAKMTGNPLYLANALRKLHTASQRIPMEANSATAHMFIVSPLRGGGFTKLFSTHPPMEERVAKLEAMVYGSIS